MAVKRKKPLKRTLSELKAEHTQYLSELVLCGLVVLIPWQTRFWSTPALSNTAEVLLGSGMEDFRGALAFECYLLLCHG